MKKKQQEEKGSRATSQYKNAPAQAAVPAVGTRRGVRG